MHFSQKWTTPLVFLALVAPGQGEFSASSCDDLGWTNALSFGSSLVCGESEVDTCQGLQTWSDANIACLTYGARLCTQAELEADETRGTGCGLDPSLVWSSSNCSTGYELSFGGSSAGIYSNCTDATDTHYVRCCADVFEDGEPTAVPSPFPTETPSQAPSVSPSFATTATSLPVPTPTMIPVPTPTTVPAPAPTSVGLVPVPSPTSVPAPFPTLEPVNAPTVFPQNETSPTAIPSAAPTAIPSAAPTSLPSLSPSTLPTMRPSASLLIPVSSPTISPTSSSLLRGSSSSKNDDTFEIILNQDDTVTIGSAAGLLVLIILIAIFGKVFCFKKTKSNETAAAE